MIKSHFLVSYRCTIRASPRVSYLFSQKHVVLQLSKRYWEEKIRPSPRLSYKWLPKNQIWIPHHFFGFFMLDLTWSCQTLTPRPLGRAPPTPSRCLYLLAHYHLLPVGCALLLAGHATSRPATARQGPPRGGGQSFTIHGYRWPWLGKRRLWAARGSWIGKRTKIGIRSIKYLVSMSAAAKIDYPGGEDRLSPGDETFGMGK